MNILELHYYLEDNSHSMNAIIKNKSETELLKLFTEVSNLLELELHFEFEAIKEGGIKDIIRYFKKKKTRGQILFYFATIISGILISQGSEYFSNDSELENLNKEEKRLNIRRLKNELENDSLSKVEEANLLNDIIFLIDDTNKVKVFKSRYYQNIKKEPKVYQISATELDENYHQISPEKTIKRSQFDNHILENENLKPKTIENANIEIISPVLKQEKIKWRGLYDGRHINFTLVDSDFRNAVLNKQYSFSNGTSIRCRLEIVLSLDENGEEVIREAKVFDVLEVFDGMESHITKKAKHLKEIQNQIKLALE